MLFFFFKQKTAYELRISDWSSDVCSSDLLTWRMSVEGICNIEGVRSAKKVSIPLRLMTPGFWSHCLAVADRLRWTYDGFFGLLASLEDFHESNGRMAISRSEERRVGKECVSQWRIRLSS